MEQFAYFLASVVRMATPLLIAGLGLMVSERAGIMNIGADGIMLIGAFAAYTATFYLGSYWYGMLASMAAGILVTALFAVAAIRFKAQQAVLGAALNILCAGIANVLFRMLFYHSGNLAGVVVESFPILPIPLLSEIPLLGKIFFQHSFIVYLGIFMTFAIWILMRKTSVGIKIIAVGEHPKAADSLGIKVITTRYLCTLFSGLMIGLSGAYLSIAQSNSFGIDMTVGKGYIALAVVILGKWHPMGVLAGAVLFGAANAVQMSIQNMGGDFPANLIKMLPYIITVIAVLSVSKNKVAAPSAIGIPYEKS